MWYRSRWGSNSLADASVFRKGMTCTCELHGLLNQERRQEACEIKSYSVDRWEGLLGGRWSADWSPCQCPKTILLLLPLQFHDSEVHGTLYGTWNWFFYWIWWIGYFCQVFKQGSKNYKTTLTKYQPEQFRVDVTCYEVDVTLDPNVGRHIL